MLSMAAVIYSVFYFNKWFKPRAKYGLHPPTPPRESFVDHAFLKAQCPRSILQQLWRLGRYAVTASYKRYPSKIKYKIEIIEIYLKRIEVSFVRLKL